MKNLLFALLAVVSIGLASCGSDSCTNADFVGTWSLQSS